MKVKLEFEKWKVIAKRINEVNDANGWERPTFELLPIKVMLAVTELDEGVQGAHGVGEDPLEVEIADTAIRLLHLLETIWPGDWHLRNGGDDTYSAHREIERLLWPILSQLCRSVEAWRHDERFDTKTALECALGECRKVARSLGIDLLDVMATKTEKNARRGYLHGKANPAG